MHFGTYLPLVTFGAFWYIQAHFVVNVHFLESIRFPHENQSKIILPLEEATTKNFSHSKREIPR